MIVCGYEIDGEKCHGLVKLLLELGIPTKKPEEAFVKIDAKSFEDFLLWNGFVTTQDTNFICQNEVEITNPDGTVTTKRVQDKLTGTLDGKPIRAGSGMHLIMQKRWKDSKEKFRPEYMSKITVKQFKELFSDDNGHYYFEPQGEMMTIRRVGYARDWGRTVLDSYGGNPTRIFGPEAFTDDCLEIKFLEDVLWNPQDTATEDQLEPYSIAGYLDKLRRFKAFRNDHPMEKLKHVFIKKVEAAGYLPETPDPRNKNVPIDYVVWESLLKMGIVKPVSKDLDNKLKNQARLTYEEIRNGRMACHYALNHLVKDELFGAEPRTNMYAIDDILFGMGYYYKRPEKLEKWWGKEICKMITHPEYLTPNTEATLLI